MTVARPFVSVNEMSLLKTFLVVLVKAECVMVSKVVVIWIKICFQLVSVIKLPICLLLLKTYVYPFMYI